ncbi:AfsR/SARP family transcriptional regulator, partial [Actinophytocola sp.]|uniref:AfsR/SARP family transcriptional regulator n=1 Tax=Actinophytocola sp. TaxID=1872138 RepID=UPI002D80240F
MDEVPELELSVTVRLLGPLEVAGTRGAVRLTGARQRAIVALLALRTPDVVSRSRLVAGLWGADPPPAAEQNLNRQLARIRLALAAVGLDGLLVTRDPGYALVLPAGSLDAGGFQAHLAAGRQAIEADYLATAAIELRVGLELWRGDPLSGCPVEDWGRAELARLREDLAGAIEALAETELRLGRPGRVADDLTRAVACQPGRERLWELLVIARHRAGQPAEALRAYRQARTALLDELGTEPGPRLRRLEMALLAGATELDPATAPPARVVRARPRPEPDEPACRQRQARLFLARLAQDARAEPGAGFAELRLATALRRYCRVPGHYREGGRWLRHALAR